MDLDRDGIVDLISGASGCLAELGGAPVHFHKGKPNMPFDYEKPIPVKTLSGNLPSLITLKDLKIPNTDYFVFDKNMDPGIEGGSIKPYFVDINDDGSLDLIYGEANGYFIQFNGSSSTGINHFSDKAELLKDVDGKWLYLKSFSTPHLIDWDGDKDFDLISGSYDGGIYFSENIGNAKEAKWKAFTAWRPAAPRVRWQNRAQNIRDEIKPGTFSSVFALDHNNDGKLDLVVGDEVQLDIPHSYISYEEFAMKEAELVTMQTNNREQLGLLTPKIRLAEYNADDSPESQAEIKKLKATYKKQKIQNRQQEFTFEKSFKSFDRKSFLWVYLQK